MTTHGMTRGPDGKITPEYRAWANIKQRCYFKEHPQYPAYGGRGITMSDEWFRSFQAFYRDMGPRPSSEHSIERENNEQGYCKENCSWSTRIEQSNNRRSNRIYEYVGDRFTLLQWCRLLDLNYDRMRYILSKGTPFEEAIEDPKAKENSAKSLHHSHRKLNAKGDRIFRAQD